MPGIVTPLPGPEQFSITPMLSSFAQGQQVKMQIDDRQQAMEQQATDAIIQAAEMADTPEQWERLIGMLEQEFPDADLSEWRDFETQDIAIGRSMTPYQRAQVSISNRQLDLQRQAANRPAAVTPRTSVGKINADFHNGLYGNPLSEAARQTRDRLVQEALDGGGEAPPKTLRLVQPDGEIHEMGWNPQSRQYDVDYGIYRGTPLIEGDEAPMSAALENEAIDASNRAVLLYGQVSELEQFREVARNTVTGFWADTTLGVRRMLHDIGIINDPNIPAQELMLAMSNQQALRLRNPDSGFGLTGNTSNRDITFLTNSVARLGATQAGNEAILTILIAKQRRDAHIAAVRSDFIWENESLRGWNEYRNEWIEDNALFKPEEEALLAALTGRTPEQVHAGEDTAIGTPGIPPPGIDIFIPDQADPNHPGIWWDEATDQWRPVQR